METDRLKQFCVVVETGVMSHAAELLGITAGGLSKSLKILVDQLGQEIFLPKGRGIEITPAGRRLYLHAKAIVEQVESMLDMETNEGSEALKLVMSESLCIPLLSSISDLWDSFNESWLSQADSSEINQALLSGEANFGFTLLPFPDKNLRFKKVGDIEGRVYSLNSKHSKLEFCDLPFIVPCSDLPHNLRGYTNRDGWPAQKIERKISYQVSHLSMALQILRQGQGVAYLPSIYETYFMKTFGEKLKRLQDPLPPRSRKMTIYLCHRNDLSESREMKKLTSAVRKLLLS